MRDKKSDLNKPAFSFSEIQLGSVVELKKALMDGKPGTMGYCYNVFAGGVSIISEVGTDLGGFTEEEQEKYLNYVGESLYLYQFKNVIQLKRDFEALIKPVFKKFI